MKLSIIFRLQAAFAALWAIQLLFLPQMVFDQFGWTTSNDLIACAQACGVAMLSLALLAYGLPSWTNEKQMNAAAKYFGIIAVLFTLLQVYHIFISHAAPGGAMDYISLGATILLGVGFFLKSNTKAAS
ncbi:MAG TPA: hypothetical protein DCX01_10725 [Bacteroidetes bacterium]|jgi:hypothetical protein|nr:hypothetical protein [Bacteroidota bacterium]